MNKKTANKVEPIIGVTTVTAKPGQFGWILQKDQLTADNPLFYMYIRQFDAIFLEPVGLSGDTLTHFFTVLHSDETADIYTNFSSEVHIQAKINKDFSAGDPIHLSDVDSVLRYKIPNVTLATDDAIVCVIKLGWRYGLLFDLTRDTSEKQIWSSLGKLYNKLLFDSILDNISKSIRESTKPHIMTEGKTDWHHIEAARRKLAPELLLSYPTSENTLGDSGLLQTCRQLAEFGPRNTNKVIAIFDRDNPKTLKELEKRGQLDTFQSWGNNVYSLVIPLPQYRVDYEYVSIEMLYTDSDITTTDNQGRRLYFDNELNSQRKKDRTMIFIPRAPILTRELKKKVFSGLAEQVVDRSGHIKGLSKALFAQLIYDNDKEFQAIDLSAFAPIFETIETILKL